MMYEKGDMVSFKLYTGSKVAYNGIVLSRWKSYTQRYVYQISSMNHGMNSFTIGQQCILKKIS